MSLFNNEEHIIKHIANSEKQPPPEWVWDNINQKLENSSTKESIVMPWEKSLKQLADTATISPAPAWSEEEISAPAISLNLMPWEKSLHELSHKSGAVVSANIWNSIEERLHEKKRRRAILLFFSAALALIVLWMFVVDKQLRNDKITSTISGERKKEIENIGKPSLEAVLMNKLQPQIKSNSPNGLNQKSLSGKNSFSPFANQDKTNDGIASEHSGDFDISKTPENFATTKISEAYAGKISEEKPLKISEANLDISGNALRKLPMTDIGPLAFGNKIKLFSEIKCPDFSNRKRPSFFIEGNLMMGKHDRNFISRVAEDNGLAERRQETELPRLSYGASMRTGLYFNRNFYAATGLSYLKSNDKFSFSYEVLDKMIIEFDPVTQERIDTTFIYTTIKIEDKVSYSHIDLPFGLGYEYFTSGWAFGGEVGILLNLKTEAHGRTFNTNFQIADLYSQGDVVKTRLGYGINASLVFRRYLTPSTSLHFNPSFRMYMNDWNFSSYPVSMDSKMLYLNVGLRKVF